MAAGYDARCWACGNPIGFGDHVVTIARNVERQDSPRDPVTVLDSEAVVTLCQACGPALDAATIQAALHAYTQGKQAAEDN